MKALVDSLIREGPEVLFGTIFAMETLRRDTQIVAGLLARKVCRAAEDPALLFFGALDGEEAIVDETGSSLPGTEVAAHVPLHGVQGNAVEAEAFLSSTQSANEVCGVGGDVNLVTEGRPVEDAGGPLLRAEVQVVGITKSVGTEPSAEFVSGVDVVTEGLPVAGLAHRDLNESLCLIASAVIARRRRVVGGGGAGERKEEKEKKGEGVEHGG